VVQLTCFPPAAAMIIGNPFFFFFILPRRSILKKKFTNFRETTDEREYLLLPGTGVKSATLETAIA
jgi:hypothetical protein